MTGERIPQSVLAVLAAVLIFGGLLSARWLMNPADRGQVSVQECYDELAVALDQAGVLPLRGPDELLMGYASLVVSLSQLSEPQMSGGVATLSLATVLSGAATDAGVQELRIRPQQWREVRPGAVRTALRRLSRLPLSKQAATVSGGSSATASGAAVGPAANFSFFIRVGTHRYRCIPYFSGQRLTEILIKPDV